LQYVPIKICGAIVMFVCEQFGVWRAGTFTVMSAQFWTANITSLSQMLAIYALLMFWRAFMVELEPYRFFIQYLFCSFDSVLAQSMISFRVLLHRTGLKLICVKGVVFFSWWQSLGVAFAVNQVHLFCVFLVLFGFVVVKFSCVAVRVGLWALPPRPVVQPVTPRNKPR
jgi:hypothetical protein